MTPFGSPVEPEVNRIFAIVSGATAACAASTAGVGAAFDSAANVGRAPIARRIGADRNFGARRHGGGDGARERGAVGGKDEAGRQRRHDRFELAEILRQQRIGHRDRRIGNADMHGGKAEQRMLDVVAGQDRDRTLGRELALQQRRRDRAHRRKRVGVGQRAPAARGVALRQEHAIRRDLGPMHQALGEIARIWRQRMRRAQQDGAVAAPLDRDLRRPELDRPQRRTGMCRAGPGERVGHCSRSYLRATLGARFSKKALSRALASSSPCAIAAASASVT